MSPFTAAEAKALEKLLAHPDGKRYLGLWLYHMNTVVQSFIWTLLELQVTDWDPELFKNSDQCLDYLGDNDGAI